MVHFAIFILLVEYVCTATSHGLPYSKRNTAFSRTHQSSKPRHRHGVDFAARGRSGKKKRSKRGKRKHKNLKDRKCHSKCGEDKRFDGETLNKAPVAFGYVHGVNTGLVTPSLFGETEEVEVIRTDPPTASPLPSTSNHVTPFPSEIPTPSLATSYIPSGTPAIYLPGTTEPALRTSVTHVGPSSSHMPSSNLDTENAPPPSMIALSHHDRASANHDLSYSTTSPYTLPTKVPTATPSALTSQAISSQPTNEESSSSEPTVSMKHIPFLNNQTSMSPVVSEGPSSPLHVVDETASGDISTKSFTPTTPPSALPSDFVSPSLMSITTAIPSEAPDNKDNLHQEAIFPSQDLIASRPSASPSTPPTRTMSSRPQPPTVFHEEKYGPISDLSQRQGGLISTESSNSSRHALPIALGLVAAFILGTVYFLYNRYLAPSCLKDASVDNIKEKDPTAIKSRQGKIDTHKINVDDIEHWDPQRRHYRISPGVPVCDEAMVCVEYWKAQPVIDVTDPNHPTSSVLLSLDALEGMTYKLR